MTTSNYDWGVRKHRILALGLGIGAMASLALIPGISAVWISEHISSAVVLLVIVLPLLALVLGFKTDTQKIRYAWVGAALWTAYVLVPVPLALYERKQTLESEREAISALAANGRHNLAQFEALGKAAAAPAKAPAMLRVDNRSALGKAAPLVQAYQADSLEAARTHLATLESIGLGKALEPAALGSPEGIVKNRRRFEQSLAEIGAYRRLSDAAAIAHREKLAVVVAESRRGRDFLGAFDESNRQRAELMAAWSANRTEAIGELSAINEFMAARQGSFSVYQGALRFGGGRDQERYRQMMANVERLAQEEQALLKQDLERRRQAVERIEAQVEK